MINNINIGDMQSLPPQIDTENIQIDLQEEKQKKNP